MSEKQSDGNSNISSNDKEGYHAQVKAVEQKQEELPAPKEEVLPQAPQQLVKSLEKQEVKQEKPDEAAADAAAAKRRDSWSFEPIPNQPESVEKNLVLKQPASSTPNSALTD